MDNNLSNADIAGGRTSFTTNSTNTYTTTNNNMATATETEIQNVVIDDYSDRSNVAEFGDSMDSNNNNLIDESTRAVLLTPPQQTNDDDHDDVENTIAMKEEKEEEGNASLRNSSTGNNNSSTSTSVHNMLNNFYVPKSKSKSGASSRRGSNASSSVNSSASVLANNNSNNDSPVVALSSPNSEEEEQDLDKTETIRNIHIQHKDIDVKEEVESSPPQSQSSPLPVDDTTSQSPATTNNNISYKFNYQPMEYEVEYYKKLYLYAASANTTNKNQEEEEENDIIPPNLAGKLFLKSGIPNDRLRLIWNMSVLPASSIPPPPPSSNSLKKKKNSSPNNNKTMTKSQFTTAIRLIQLFQNRITAKDEMLRVNTNVIMAPAYFEGVSGVIVPLPWNNNLKDQQHVSVNEVNVVEVKKKEVPNPQQLQQQEEGAATASLVLKYPSKSNNMRRATEISSLGGGSANNNDNINNKATARRRRSSNTLSSSSSLEGGGGGCATNAVDGGGGSVNNINKRATARRSSNKLTNSLRSSNTTINSKDSAINNHPKHSSSSETGDSPNNREQVEPTTTTGENNGTLRRRSSAFPPRVTNERSTTRVSYAGNENEYVMFENEWLTYQDTFSRHCVIEGQGGTISSEQRHVYVDAAVTLFEKSKLDRETIGKIWDIVVEDPNAAKLDEKEFVLMTHLIVCVISRGLEVPTELPVHLRLWKEKELNDGAAVTAQNDAGQGKEAEQAPLLPGNSGTTADSDQPNANRRSSEKERFVRMENEIKSLSQLVESLTTEIHDLKEIVQKEKESPIPAVVNRKTSANHANGGRVQTSAPSIPVVDIDAPTVDVEVYWGEKNNIDTSDRSKSPPPTKKWVCDAGCNAVFDSYEICLAHERTCRARSVPRELGVPTAWPASQAASPPPKRMPASERLRMAREMREKKEKALRMSRSVPAFHPSSLPSSGRPQPQMNRVVEYPKRETVGSGVAKSLMMNGGQDYPRRDTVGDVHYPRRDTVGDGTTITMKSAPVDYYGRKESAGSSRPAQMKPGILKRGSNLDISERSERSQPSSLAASFKPAKLQMSPGTLKGGKQSLDTSERSASRVSYAQSMPVHDSVPAGVHPSRPSRQIYASMPQGGVNQTIPEEAESFVTSNQPGVNLEHMKQHAQLNDEFPTRQNVQPARQPTSRPPREMYRSMPQSSVPPSAQGMPGYGDRGMAKSVMSNTPDSLAAQMEQVQREEQFDGLMQGAMSRLGGSGDSTSNGPSRSAPNPRRGSTNAHGSSFNSKNSFQPAQLNMNRNMMTRNQRGDLAASARHIKRRKSGTTSIYPKVKKASTAALDLPPLS